MQTQLTMNGSRCTLLLSCLGVLSDTFQPGGASLYTPLGAGGFDNRLPRTFRSGPVTDTLQISWNGTGTGTIPDYLPVDWDFFAWGGGGASDLQWQVNLSLDGTAVYSSGMNPLTSPEVVGDLQWLSTSGLAGQAFNTWSLSLSIRFQADDPGDFVLVDVPRGHTLDLGSAATPEPASFGLAGAALLLAGLVRRRARKS